MNTQSISWSGTNIAPREGDDVLGIISCWGKDDLQIDVITRWDGEWTNRANNIRKVYAWARVAIPKTYQKEYLEDIGEEV